tara:strand:- start:7539 stop:7733 length:195 start_codon:yes stop_codon:yes gene_type:complete
MTANMDELDMVVYIWFYMGLFCTIALIGATIVYLIEMWRAGHEEFVLFWSSSVGLILIITIIII